jgi:hypothetical protein
MQEKETLWDSPKPARHTPKIPDASGFEENSPDFEVQ